MNDEPTQPTSESTEPEGQAAALPREAANYRRRLRTTEQERDQLRERLDATHWAQVEKAAADRFTDPSDLWNVTTLDDMRDDAGLIDPAKAEAAMSAVLAAKPHLRPAPASRSSSRWQATRA